jgi:hypothetical protein
MPWNKTGDLGIASLRESVAPLASAKSLFAGTNLYGYGNSWMDDSYWFARIFDRLGFNRPAGANKATGGYRMQDTAITALSPGEKTWTPGTGGYVLVNDLGNNMGDPDTVANRGAALESARALAAILSSVSKVESDAAGWVYSSGWLTTAMDFGGASGGSHAATQTNGAYVDFPVPAGTSYLVCFGGNGAEYIGGAVTVTQGSKSFVKDLNNKAYRTIYRAEMGVAPVIVKLENMEAGTARATFSSDRAGWIATVDCLLTPMASPPVQVWTRPCTVLEPAYTNKPDLFNYLRGIPDTIAAEFPNIVVMDPLPGWNPNTMLLSDRLHPNALGSAHVADMIVSGFLEHKMRLIASSSGSGPIVLTQAQYDALPTPRPANQTYHIIG